MKIKEYLFPTESSPDTYLVRIEDERGNHFVKIYKDYSGISLGDSGFNNLSDALELITFLIQHKKEIIKSLNIDFNKII